MKRVFVLTFVMVFALGALGVAGLEKAAADADLASELEAYGVEELSAGSVELSEAAALADEAEPFDAEPRSPGEQPTS